MRLPVIKYHLRRVIEVIAQDLFAWGSYRYKRIRHMLGK